MLATMNPQVTSAAGPKGDANFFAMRSLYNNMFYNRYG